MLDGKEGGMGRRNMTLEPRINEHEEIDCGGTGQKS